MGDCEQIGTVKGLWAVKREVHRAEVSTCGQQITQDCSYTAVKVGCLEESGMMICVGERWGLLKGGRALASETVWAKLWE